MIRFAQIYRNNDDKWFLQIAKKYDLTVVDTAWQASDELGDACLTPSVDIEAEIIACSSEADAMLQLSVHYANEYHKHTAIKAPY
jgi:hypothetical protein